MLQVTRGPTVAPMRLMLYGQEGVGKTTWAKDCPSCLVLTAEDGGGDSDYARAIVDTWPGLRSAVRDLIRDPMGFRAIAIDTIDTYERLLHKWLCEEHDKRSIEQIGGGYGKGYTVAAEEMTGLAAELDELRQRQKVHVILLGHAQVKTFNDPLGNPYDRYELRMHKTTSALWMGWADAVLFACFDVTVKTANWKAKDDKADPNAKGKATAAKRVVYTAKDAAFDAKNRYGLPEEIPLSWAAFSKAIRWDERDAALTHADHPSWSADAPKFTAELEKLGMLAEAVDALCTQRGRPRPSRMDLDTRRKLLGWLAKDEGRAAYQAIVDERDKAAVVVAESSEQGAA